ncbi:MAG: protein serine phosphatase [Bacteroidetes bacterium QH_8_67_23]|nr:MAG: protein serine phosphatase [Bacteroidetes bacterium QH_8_67_23]
MSRSLSTWTRTFTRWARAVHERLPQRVWGIVFGACFLGGLGVRLAFGETGAAALMQEGLALIGFAALWIAVQPVAERWSASPLRRLGALIVAGAGLGGTVALVTFIEPAGEASSTGAVLQRHGLVLMEMAFVFFLLLQLRRLALYRRTRVAQRNWRLMLLLMSIAALTAFGHPPGRDPGALQVLPMSAAVALMVVNSFRLSWIVDLSVRQKGAGAALSVGVLVAVSLSMSLPMQSPGSALPVYSYALHWFALQAGIFGILYSLTTLLSLVFHLPTTGDVQRKTDETAVLHNLTQLVEQTFDAERLSKSIAAAPVEAGLADAAWLALPGGASERLIRDDATEAPQVVAAAPLAAAEAERAVDLETLFAKVRRTQAPLVLSHARTDRRVHTPTPDAPTPDALTPDAPASLLVAPLVARGTFAGALFAARDVARGFEDDDVSSIQAFASQAALALDHARLFEEQIEKERLERELDIARSVQERLLPRRLPEIDGLALAAGSTPAREVGGDYYDFTRLDDGRLAFIIADVSGKGTQAAFYMAEMQGLFHSLSRLKPDPTAFLCHANDALRDILEDGTFVTALYGLIDPQEGTLTLARAGHCPAALAREGDAPRLLRPDGMGLGLAPTVLFKNGLTPERLPLRPGDALALYTDGLVESRSSDTSGSDPGGEEYGYDRLLDALQRHRCEPPAALQDGLLADLRAFTAADAYDDDLTLVVLQWQGADDDDENALRSVPASTNAVASITSEP